MYMLELQQFKPVTHSICTCTCVQELAYTHILGYNDTSNNCFIMVHVTCAIHMYHVDTCK